MLPLHYEYTLGLLFLIFAFHFCRPNAVANLFFECSPWGLQPGQIIQRNGQELVVFFVGRQLVWKENVDMPDWWMTSSWWRFGWWPWGLCPCPPACHCSISTAFNCDCVPLALTMKLIIGTLVAPSDLVLPVMQLLASSDSVFQSWHGIGVYCWCKAERLHLTNQALKGLVAKEIEEERGTVFVQTTPPLD